jgi:hypothetical protein
MSHLQLLHMHVLCAGSCDTAKTFAGQAEALCVLGNFYIRGSCSKWRGARVVEQVENSDYASVHAMYEHMQQGVSASALQ